MATTPPRRSPRPRRHAHPTFKPNQKNTTKQKTKNKGLEDQLLGRLILREKGELEQQRQALLSEATAYRAKIAQLEADLLDRLSNSQVRVIWVCCVGVCGCGVCVRGVMA
jgi:dynein heavy chain